MYGGFCINQVGVQDVFATIGLSFTGGNWIDCSTVADNAHVYITQESPFFLMGANVTDSLAYFNTYWSVFSGSGPTYQQEALLQAGIGIATRTIPTVYGTRASPVSISATGFVTGGTNISTSAVDQVVFAAGSTANALTTITAATPISICNLPSGITGVTAGKGNHLKIIGSSTTAPILLPWKTGKLEIKGDFILSNGSSIDLLCDGTAWREISRSQGGGVGADNTVAEGKTPEGFFGPQNLVVNSGAEAGSRFAGATVSAGTFALTTTAADVGRGAQSFTWDASANAQTFTTTQVSIPQGMYGANCFAGFSYKGGDALLNWQVWDGTSIIPTFNAGSAVTLATSAGWTSTTMGFTCPSSGTLGIKMTATGNAAIIKFDSLTIRAQFETGAFLTGFVSGAGTLTAAKTILQGFNILDGNIAANTTSIALKAPLASPTFTGDVNSSTGNVLISTIGKGLQVKTGANSKIGQATLVGGTVTVANTSVTANSRIFLSVSTAGGVQGLLSYTKNAGTDFTITSSNIADTSTVDWYIVESIP